MNDRVEGKWLGAFLSSQATGGRMPRLKPLIAPTHDLRTHAKWLQKERPEAVLAAEEYDWKRICMELRLARPALGWLMLRQSAGRKAGGLGRLDYRPEQLGQAALETVVSQIQRNERGEPSVPRTVLIEAEWIAN